MNMPLDDWLDNLHSMFPSSLTGADFVLVKKYAAELRRLLSESPSGSMPHPDFLNVKARLASSGYGAIDVPLAVGGCGRSTLVQMLIQFVSGYNDIDLRDAAHISHGRMVLRYGSAEQVQHWLPRIIRGELVGIAATEIQGGTTLHSIKTEARKSAGSTWSLSGEKSWISRINEASVFVVFFKTDDKVSAALIDAKLLGIRRKMLEPTGLRGWSWGTLQFDNVSFDESDFLGERNRGLDVFRDHFVYYRPMVAAVALGAVAAAFDTTLAHLQMRISEGTIKDCRDSALESLARNYFQIQSSLFSALVAQEMVARGAPMAEAWSRAVKAQSVDTAYRAISELALYSGAKAYEENNQLGKMRRDLWGLMYADGVQDALYRSAGRALVGSRMSSG